MTVDATNALSSYQNIATNGQTGTNSGADLDALTQDYTTFINMLTTQLKNQDPLSPMDSTQFTQQLVAFAGVEQQIKSNSKLDSLISLQQSGGSTQYLNYIGKEIEVSSDQVPLTSTTYGKFSYTLPNVATTAKVEISNSDGTVVRTQNVSTGVGKHVIQWDGKNDDSEDLPNGTYTVKVTAVGADGAAIKPTYTSYGVVTGVDSSSGSINFSVGQLSVALADILSVNQGPVATTTTTDNSNNNSGSGDNTGA